MRIQNLDNRANDENYCALITEYLNKLNNKSTVWLNTENIMSIFLLENYYSNKN